MKCQEMAILMGSAVSISRRDRRTPGSISISSCRNGPWRSRSRSRRPRGRAEGEAPTLQLGAALFYVLDIEHELDQRLTLFLALAGGMQQQRQTAGGRSQLDNAIAVAGDRFVAKERRIERGHLLGLLGEDDDPMKCGWHGV